MYKLFCNNLENFIIINECEKYPYEYRNKMIKPLKVLADVHMYNQLKHSNIELYNYINHVVYKINNLKNKYHSFITFSWELWGSGFIAKKNEKYENEDLNEQIKLINLLLGTQYWKSIPQNLSSTNVE